MPFDSDTTIGSNAFALDSYKPPPAHDPGLAQATASSVACGLGRAFDGARIYVARQADPARAEAAPAGGGTMTKLIRPVTMDSALTTAARLRNFPIGFSQTECRRIRLGRAVR